MINQSQEGQGAAEATVAGQPSDVGVEVGYLSNRRRFLRRALRHRGFVISFLVCLLFVAMAAFPQWLAPHDPIEIDSEHGIELPTPGHLLGRDQLGRDLLSRAIYGARTSLFVALSSVVIAAVIGVPLGLMSGYLGGWVDTVISRIMDAILAFPLLLFAILVLSLLGGVATNLVLTIGAFYMPFFARLARGNTLSVKQEDYVLAGQSIGASHRRVLLKYILPNITASLTVQATLAIAVAMLIEANLSFLGLGVQPPTPSWGRMVLNSAIYIHINPWYMLAPGLCIFFAVTAFNIMGDGLRDVLDPRLLIK